MDDDSCSKFIGSLTKYLQSLCHSYVDFDNGVELVGHIYLNVDTGKKIDYVLNESVCKNGANVVKFTSNSYHAQPVEKQKKETPKKAPDPPKQSESRKKNDDDDVIIVGSEGSRRNRTGSSPSRSHASPGQMQRGVTGQHRIGQQPQGGLFRHPRGPNPRMGGPVPRASGYTYQPRQRLTYPQQPRGFLNIQTGYNPRMRQPHYPQPRGTQPLGVRGSSPVDTDVTFMREEYVTGQPNSRAGPQPGQTGQQPSYPYQAGARQPPHMQSHLQQRYMAPYTQASVASTQPTSMALPLTTMPTTSMGVAMATSQPPASLASNLSATMTSVSQSAPGQEVGVAGNMPSTTVPSFFHTTQPALSPVSGGMPLPVTTHTIFDSGPVMPSSADLPSSGQVGGMPGTTVAPATPSDVDPLATSMTTAGVSSLDTAPATSGAASSSSGAPMDPQSGFVIGQVWSESSAAPDPATTQASESALSGVSTPPAASLQSAEPPASGGHSGNVFDAFNQLPPSQPPTSEPSSSSPFSSGLSQAGNVSNQNSAGGDGDRFSALVSELQAFNQQPSSQPLPGTVPSGGGTHPPSSSPMGGGYPTDAAATAAAPAEGSGDGVNAHPLMLTSSGLDVKKDPGDIGVNIATAVLRESTEAAANEAPETFLAPLGMGGSQGTLHGGLEGYRKRSGSASSHSQGTPSPSSGSLVGPESVVIETKPFLQHASDYDSGCDSASASTGERLASPQGAPHSAPHSQLRSLSIPLVPVDSPTSSVKSIDVKRERLEEEDTEPEQVKNAESEWNKGSESEWITDMSALNNSDDSMDSASDDAQDDDDPSYTPGRPIDTDKGRARKRAIHREIHSDTLGHRSDGQQHTSSDQAHDDGGHDQGDMEEDIDTEDDAEEEDASLPASTVLKKRKAGLEGLFKRKTWTNEEKLAVERHFKAFIEDQKLPGKLEIEAVLDQEPVLKGRTWQNIKDFCRNAHLGSAKRARNKQSEKGSKGKKRKLDTPESEGGAEEQTSLSMEVTTEADVHSPPAVSPPLESEQQQLDEGGGGDTLYKPGTFILVNVSKESERSSRTRPMHTPAEVIATPTGQAEGVWVHTLVPAGNGLWRLPSIDQITDLKVDPVDIVKTLDHANVKIVGAKVFYKFDDMITKKKMGSALKHKQKK